MRSVNIQTEFEDNYKTPALQQKVGNALQRVIKNNYGLGQKLQSQSVLMPSLLNVSNLQKNGSQKDDQMMSKDAKTIINDLDDGQSSLAHSKSLQNRQSTASKNEDYEMAETEGSR